MIVNVKTLIKFTEFTEEQNFRVVMPSHILIIDSTLE